MTYTRSYENRRLTGHLEQHGSKSGMPTLGLFIFGLIFFLSGGLMILCGLKIVPLNPKNLDAPHWILSAMGAAFVLASTLIWNLVKRQAAANRRVREAKRLYPGERAFQDYSWDTRGFQPQRWKPALSSLKGAIFLTVFLGPFNWWAYFSAQSPPMLKVIVGLFDLTLLLIIGYAVLQIGRAFKFGDSRILFAQFPYRLGQPVMIRWQPPSGGLFEATRGSFTLRCVKEYYETTGSGKQRTKRLVHEQIWESKWEFNEPRSFSGSDLVELTFEAPGDLPPAELHSLKPVFWELEVKIEMPGLDFSQRYLVPVYEPHSDDANAFATGQNAANPNPPIGG